MLIPWVSDSARTMEEGAVNGAAEAWEPGSPRGSWVGEGREGRSGSQPRGSEPGLIGRGCSSGGRKGEGITCWSAAEGQGSEEVAGPAGIGRGRRKSLGPADLETWRKTVGKPAKKGPGSRPAGVKTEQGFLGWATLGPSLS